VLDGALWVHVRHSGLLETSCRAGVWLDRVTADQVASLLCEHLELAARSMTSSPSSARASATSGSHTTTPVAMRGAAGRPVARTFAAEER